jgi:hypothetical protein
MHRTNDYLWLIQPPVKTELIKQKNLQLSQKSQESF